MWICDTCGAVPDREVDLNCMHKPCGNRCIWDRKPKPTEESATEDTNNALLDKQAG